MFKTFHRSNALVLRVLLLSTVLLIAGCSKSPQERAQAYYEQGAKFLSQKDYVKATIEFKNALQSNDAHVGAWRGLAEVEEQNKNWRGLVPILRKVSQLDPKDTGATLKLARLLVLGNALEDALKLINSVLELNDKDVGALVLKAATLLKLNDTAGAISDAQKALEIDPGNVEALIVLAAERAGRGDTKGALAILARAPQTDKPSFGVQLFKIQLFEKLGDYKQVETLLQKLVDLYPQEALFRRQLVALYTSQKRLDEAEKELRAISSANPTDVQTGLDVVRFLISFKGPDSGRQELLARIAAGGHVFPYQIALAEFDFAQGKVSDSVQMLETLIKTAKTPEDVLAAQNKLAELHLKTKKIDAADAVVSSILQKDSRNLGGLKLRATIRLERGQLDPAITDLRQALNDQPRAADIMLLLAVAYERSGSMDLAEKQYAEATRASGFNAGTGLTYISFLQRRGKPALAEDVLAELATRWPTNIRVLSALANVKLQHRDFVGAEEIAKSIRELGSSPVVADQILGEALSGRNKIEEGIEALQSAYAAAPTATPPMVGLVRAFMRANQPDRAIAFLQEAVKKNPDNGDALVLLGSTQLATGKQEQALKSFKTAIERQPKISAGYMALSSFQIRQKKYDDALEVVRAGLKSLPENFSLRLTQAGIFELKGDYEGAITEYEALLKAEAGSLIVANNLASLLTDHRTDKASLDRAAALIPNLQKSQVPYFKDTIGWVQYRRGEFKPAVALLEQAANELPNQPMIRYHLGMSYIAIGQNEKASEQLQKALSLAANDNSLQEKVRAAQKQAGIY